MSLNTRDDLLKEIARLQAQLAETTRLLEKAWTREAELRQMALDLISDCALLQRQVHTNSGN